MNGVEMEIDLEQLKGVAAYGRWHPLFFILEGKFHEIKKWGGMPGLAFS